jgi:hypothetical protein
MKTRTKRALGVFFFITPFLVIIIHEAMLPGGREDILLFLGCMTFIASMWIGFVLITSD